MQTLAAARCANVRVKMLDRDRLDRVWRFSGSYRTIMNGWYMYDPAAWPPSPRIDPLFISFHLSNRVGRRSKEKLRAREHLLFGENLEYFRRHSQIRGIGVRDYSTLRAFNDAGIDAYFSGCLTLTLTPRNLGIRSETIIAVDLDPEAIERLRQRSAVPVSELTHTIPRRMSVKSRMRRLNELLGIYETAAVVVTSRLHVALPCVALGTPVLFIHKNLDDPRFGGLIDHVHSASRANFLSARYDYDLNMPPRNFEGWKPMANDLKRRVEAFVSE